MKLNAYVMFGGDCERAIEFYKDVFDAQTTVLMRYGEAPPDVLTVPEGQSQKIMHATLEFGGVSLQVCDNLDPSYSKGNDVHLSVNLESVEEAAAVFNSLTDGGKVTMPFADAFWGGKFGMCTDRFGVQWMVSSEHKPA